MNNFLKKTFDVQVLASVLFVFCLSALLWTGDATAQNNEWKNSAPNPPSGLTTDASGLIANGAKDFDFDQFESEVNLELAEVNNNPNYSNNEKQVRLKVLHESIVAAEEGFSIEASFDIAFMKLNPIVENKAPQIDLSAIVSDYKVQFEQ